jgi:large subunit ribosomal protein L23
MKIILEKPKVSEKTSSQLALGKYTFLVGDGVNKHEISDFVEKTYGVSVIKVNTLIMPSKERRRGRVVGRTPRYKKAIVTLKSGENIDSIKGLV